MDPVRKVIVIGGDRLDVIALALGLRANRTAVINRLLGALRVDRQRSDAESIANDYCRDTPGGNCTTGVVVQRLTKALFAFREPERMQKRHAALQTLLRLWRTGIGESYRAELF